MWASLESPRIRPGEYDNEHRRDRAPRLPFAAGKIFTNRRVFERCAERRIKMKYAFVSIVLLALLAVAPSVGAADAATYKGDIIDTMCLTGHAKNIKEFVPTHTKECVLKEGCRDSGMNLYQADGKVLKFDEASSGKIVGFLEKKDSKLQVVVTAEKNEDGTYKLVTIKNQ
jgi:hypothetical protein